ncbi:MAG: hypothetical protein KKC20_24795 [Proteobacteria bacterium]|nr:hypothetical protein [Pseudomonadota bacterium]
MSDIDQTMTKTTTVIDWSSGIFAIFWGVWWTTVYEAAISKAVELNIQTPFIFKPGILSALLPIIVAAYTLLFVMWMWKIRSLPWILSVKTRILIFVPIVFSVLGFCFLYYSLFRNDLITIHQYMYGSILSFTWIFVTSIIARISRYWG